MLRIRPLLPLIGYSPIQLLTLAYATSELCAMSLRTFAAAHVFFYRSSASNFWIGFFPLRSPNKRVDTFPAKTPASTTFVRCHSERSGRVQFPRTDFRSARPRSRSAYFAADDFRRISLRLCLHAPYSNTRTNCFPGICRMIPRISISHRAASVSEEFNPVVSTSSST
jgi:hypothetical protein